MRKKTLLWIMAIVVLSATFALQISTHVIYPSSLSARNRNNALTCTWQTTGDQYIEVFWFRNGVLYKNLTNPTDNQSTLFPHEFARGEAWSCYINVSNSTSKMSSSIDATIVNAWPLFQDTSNETFLEDETKSICINATDADGDALVFIYSSDIEFDSFNAGTGCLSWTPGNSSIGSHSITYRVTDSLGASDPNNATAIYTVTEFNDLPYMTPAPALLSYYQNDTMMYFFTGHDEETDAGPFNWTLNSSYVTQVGVERLGITKTSDTQAYMHFNSISPAQRENGTYTVTVTVCEEVTGGCSSGSFSLEVVSVNFNPLFLNHTNQTWTQGGSMLFYINATDYNIEDELLVDVYAAGCQSPDPWVIQNLLPNHENATGLINVTQLNNSHVDCSLITVMLSDQRGGMIYKNVSLDITNTNDLPEIQDKSYHPVNTIPGLNHNLTNLTAAINLPFIHRVNATDPDTYIESWGETLTFSSNATSCGMSCPYFQIAADGTINLTVTQDSFIDKYYSYNITVEDKSGATASKVLSLYVKNNTLPSFMQALHDMNITEDEEFSLKVNGTDPDYGDIVSYFDNMEIFNISSAGLIAFQSDCSMVDRHEVEINLTDLYGGTASDRFNLSILFGADAPTIQNFTRIVPEGITLTVPVLSGYVNDEDLDPVCQNQTDSLTLSYEVPPELANYSTAVSGALFTVTPAFGVSGIFLINITVNDSYGLGTTGIFTLTVINQSNPPVIHNVTAANSSDLSSWISTSRFPGNISNVQFAENVGNITFNHTTTDFDLDPLHYTWYFNGTNVSHNLTYTREFWYNASGQYNITLVVADNVSDYLLHNISFVWNLTVTDVNRPPYMTRNFSNITFGGSSYYREDYFTTGDARFVDPDGDNMTFSVDWNNSYVNHSTIQINGSDLVIYALSVGLDHVRWIADDGEDTAYSNNITVNVTWVAPAQSVEEDTESETTTRTRTITTTIIQEVEKENPILLDLIVPEPVTVYQNNTIRAPLSLVNNANMTLKGVKLSASTNNSMLDMVFADEYFPQLAQGQKVTTELIITSYKTFSNYEIVVYANVTDPKYSDSAIVYVNSLEKSEGNESVANTKITFARDLLSSNPECLELNEFISRAESAIARKDYAEADKMLESVIQGCKYLVSRKDELIEKPSGFPLLAYMGTGTFMAVSGVLVIAMIGFFVVSMRKPKKRH